MRLVLFVLCWLLQLRSLPADALLYFLSSSGSRFRAPLRWMPQKHRGVHHDFSNLHIIRSSSGETEFFDLRAQICAYNNSELFEKYSSIIPITLEILRKEYGTNNNTFWGDLSALETRELYQKLLPRVVLIADEFKEMPLKDKAYIASMARYAAKLYTRERSMVPERAAANLYDGARHFSRTGRLSWTGPTVDEIWLKYESDLRREYGYACDEDTRQKVRRSPLWEGKINWEWVRPPGLNYWPPNGFWGPRISNADNDVGKTELASPREGDLVEAERKAKPDISEEELYRRLYERVLKKSCTTNPFIDRIALGNESKRRAIIDGHDDVPSDDKSSCSVSENYENGQPEVMRVGPLSFRPFRF
jgi:hypothetical protein